MINAIIIESVMILLLGFLFYLTLKKNKALRDEIYIQERTKEQALDNIESYKMIIDKLNRREKESEEVKKQIATASGAALAALANSL